MSGWLPKEVLDHLEHAGYVAVPKERIEMFWAEMRSEPYELIHAEEHRRSIGAAIARNLAQQIGVSLLKRGFLDIEQSLLDDDYSLRHRVFLHALKPRTIKAGEGG